MFLGFLTYLCFYVICYLDIVWGTMIVSFQIEQNIISINSVSWGKIEIKLLLRHIKQKKNTISNE